MSAHDDWKPRTHADVARERRARPPSHAGAARLAKGAAADGAREALAAAAAGPATDPGRERVTCPRCGRRTWGFALLEVSAVPAEVRAVGRRGAPADAADAAVAGGEEYACDACWTGWVRGGHIARHELARALGAPEALVAHVQGQVNHHVP
ncbi:MAG: hypothetical protein JWM27_1549 [Gemmatimonadetes bacterium]|nr:hypothetical protein [Gemmatimonadota bacterium]